MLSKLNDLFTFKINWILIVQKSIQIILTIFIAILTYYIVRYLIGRILFLSEKASFRSKNKAYLEKRQKTISRIITSILRYIVYFLTLIVILAILGVNVQTVLAGAGILGVVFAIGSQEIIKDFLDGFFNIFEDNISVGDYVEIDGVEGTIIDIRLRNLKIKSYSGEIHIVPNSKIGHLINYSLDNGKAIVDIKLDYTENVDHVMKVMTDAFPTIKDGNRNILTLPIIQGVNRLESIGYDIRIVCETVKETHWSVQRYMRGQLLMLFEENEIQVGKYQIHINDSLKR